MMSRIYKGRLQLLRVGLCHTITNCAQVSPKELNPAKAIAELKRLTVDYCIIFCKVNTIGLLCLERLIMPATRSGNATLKLRLCCALANRNLTLN
jgi:hypothetical protein